MQNSIKVSENFKKKATNAIFSIALFILVYILLFCLALAFTALCAAGGIMLMTLKISGITIMLGLGLISLGLIILFFLIKFIFKKHTVDRSHLIEVTEEEEPQLFAFIKDIVEKVGTDFPKKVYFSSDVNAAVFYDSSFWSMFLPIKKNLQIGIGLVNTITVSELRAILAHEFGHFSQKSMKVGSYVYNVNQVIYNMLFDNESFNALLIKWAEVSSYFSIFVSISVKIIQGIQWVLQKMYGIVNLNYMGLSREMEFHADEVAANLTGYLPLKNSLLRMDLAEQSYSSVLNYYDKRVPDSVRSKNIYVEQSLLLNFLAQDMSIPFENQLPKVPISTLNKYNKSKLNIKNQWASHPSTEDRIAALEKLNIVLEQNDTAIANTIFKNIEKIQTAFTDKIFSQVQYSSAVSYASSESFFTDFTEVYKENDFPKIYNGYYNHKNPIITDINSITNKSSDNTIENLFDDKKVENVYTFLSLENDINTLNQIQNKELEINTFDYDGIKYNADDVDSLIVELEQEKEKIKLSIEENDKNIYIFFNSLAKAEQQSELKHKYQTLLNSDIRFDEKAKIYTQLINATQFIQYTTQIEVIEQSLREVAILEQDFKIQLKDMLEDKLYLAAMHPKIKEQFEKYLEQDWIYFKSSSYDNDALDILFNAIHNYSFILTRAYFLAKKELLDFQVEIYQKQ